MGLLYLSPFNVTELRLLSPCRWQPSWSKLLEGNYVYMYKLILIYLCAFFVILLHIFEQPTDNG